ncbi:Holliday junction DNA helicase RuvA [Candidatus Roizmanbacteria bacterium RIFCSPHIGHO2_02_FULL_37_15]|uniref:Holliday junction branch migration complex subunit RuvA n=1 Tax=Candidatus Roizmanbacteria bacterium RIFCSPLOWO2_01_FULL_37_16 TaxID=1802058 RepID=A0A1F7IKM1_9BACT|nr:MAG: Holliday junction DNA helicase RuvA [Candidatus Roizmanbacteria bacterium RIFCSPHIGHO2_01_FULL_37_16b]OGK20479.1 MAG: Holliday junction DNA helicase RuvA [Candidatus Roizmanbacteria bacterium RIFCSPHIGHO2_02_FULL_37_15]OGK31746.1 MAG: Holliday junction DNA helicase RuvA [Candidatus Roizmanbacteria bacterium RIFCSPHIGHO2_12_FULL_36_11]OGK43906.1 MAG: Holliday junction DNA helicase RuvA [Candidatus Roizmanbacteria bacterium RIFCSPLOWO2_01_FULL_37_16]OGK55831.1 MAG: Holliday junction DNA h
MIGKIKGELVEIDGNLGLIMTSGGVFYQVYLTPSILKNYKKKIEVEVYTYLQVREDALVLFGFESKAEYDFFKLLLGVSGVGPKTAFSIISFSRIDDITEAVKKNSTDYFSRIPGLGKKTALKIILELSEKLDAEFKLEKMYLSEDDKTVVDALVSLGFKSNEAKKILGQLPNKISIENKIKEAIRLATNPKN